MLVCNYLCFDLVRTCVTIAWLCLFRLSYTAVPCCSVSLPALLTSFVFDARAFGVQFLDSLPVLHSALVSLSVSCRVLVALPLVCTLYLATLCITHCQCNVEENQLSLHT